MHTLVSFYIHPHMQKGGSRKRAGVCIVCLQASSVQEEHFSCLMKPRVGGISPTPGVGYQQVFRESNA